MFVMSWFCWVNLSKEAVSQLRIEKVAGLLVAAVISIRNRTGFSLLGKRLY